MKWMALALAFSTACAAAGTPHADAEQLLAWVKQSRPVVNRAGKSADKATLARIKKETYRLVDKWPPDAGHRQYRPCWFMALDMANFLQAYDDKDWRKRDQMQRQFREDLPVCESLVRNGY